MLSLVERVCTHTYIYMCVYTYGLRREPNLGPTLGAGPESLDLKAGMRA